jgi:hypothetical protein
MRFALTLVVALAALKLLVWWLEPRMAFFPIAGVQRDAGGLQLDFEDVEIETATVRRCTRGGCRRPSPARR